MSKKEKVINVLKQMKNIFNIQEFVLFGSYAKETAHNGSDVDIAYILKDGQTLSFENYLQLEERLSTSLNTKIDLMNFKKLNPLVKLHAQKDFIYV